MKYTVAVMKVMGDELRSATTSNSFKFPVRPRQIEEGGLMLLSEHYNTRGSNEKPIRYKINFSKYEELENHTKSKHGRPQRYKIFGSKCRRLRRGIDISEIKVSSKNYKRARNVVYVERVDVEILLTERYLE